VSESTTQEMVVEAIFAEVHRKCYVMAKEVPFCNGKLFDDFDYVTNTPGSKTILNGTYQAFLDSDKVSKYLFDKIAATRKLFSKDSISNIGRLPIPKFRPE
jgi:hypothetical protein